jgi:hypothetical protein
MGEAAMFGNGHGVDQRRHRDARAEQRRHRFPFRPSGSQFSQCYTYAMPFYIASLALWDG